MYLGSRNLGADRYKILHVGCRPWHNHACQFRWRSVKGFWRCEESNSGLCHWLSSSPLQHKHYGANVWYLRV